MRSWLQLDENPADLSAMELAEWLRHLPNSKVKEETKKVVARRVLEQEVDGRDFQAIFDNNRWPELDVADSRQAAAIARLFRQKQQETALAEAASQNAMLN